ncbi:MAG: polysialyltransferase family glycosyltransferase [Faecalibacterium sp.]
MDLGVYADAILINTQPFLQDRMLSSDQDIEILTKICECLHNNGYKIVLKLHPREKNLERYAGLKKFVVIAKGQAISQEALLANIEVAPKAIIGFSSTTLVTAKLFFDLPTISLVQFWDLDALNPKFRMEQEQFLKTFSNIVACPNSLEALFQVLSEKT